MESEQKFLQNFKKKIIKDTLKTLFKKYQIYDNEGINLMSQDVIEKELLSPKIIKRCIGTTNTLPITQCSRNALDDCDYCKTHIYKLGITNIQNHHINKPPILFQYQNNNDDKTLPNKNCLKKKFIDDTFYFIDDKFIYDNTLNKVGIIDNNNYILTSDPFILDVPF